VSPWRSDHGGCSSRRALAAVMTSGQGLSCIGRHVIDTHCEASLIELKYIIRCGGQCLLSTCPVARHAIQRMLNPRSMNEMTFYDVASNVWPALPLAGSTSARAGGGAPATAADRASSPRPPGTCSTTRPWSSRLRRLLGRVMHSSTFGLT
jgi:hypothetical protein